MQTVHLIRMWEKTMIFAAFPIFGCDLDQRDIFVESAGASLVSTLLISPSAKNLDLLENKETNQHALKLPFVFSWSTETIEFAQIP